MKAEDMNIYDKLVDQAMKLGHHKTKEEAVTAALEKYVLYRKQLRVKDSFGTFTFDKNYKYKNVRGR